MSAWLENAENRALFDTHRVAYITLVKEGHQKVTLQNIEMRISMLKWFWNAMCSHPTSRTIMPLTEIMQEGCPHRPASISDLTLVTIASSSGNSLGAYVPVEFGSDSPGAIARPVPPNRPQHLHEFNFLATDKKADFDLLGKVAPLVEAAVEAPVLKV